MAAENWSSISGTLSGRQKGRYLVADVKWIKLTTDMFDNRKIKHLRRLPDGDSIVLIWVMLLTMAGRCNSGGMIFLTENIPYTPKMLADELDFEENTVKLALASLEQLNMIVANNGFFTIAGWDEHQNIEGMEKIRESKRLAQARWRAKQKELPEPSTVDSTVDSTRYLVDDAEEDKEEEIEIDKDKEKKESVTCKQVIDLYHSICISFPKIRSLSDARKKAIKARLNAYSLEDLEQVFRNAEASSFLKGSNDRNWSANFDWLIADKNIAKVLEGNYADKRKYGRKEPVPGWCQHSLGEAELEAIQSVLQEDTAATNPEIADRAERLKQRLGV
jgi:predicted phage replisome organizer